VRLVACTRFLDIDFKTRHLRNHRARSLIRLPTRPKVLEKIAQAGRASGIEELWRRDLVLVFVL